MKMLKKDMVSLLDQLEELTEIFKINRFAKLCEDPNLMDKANYWNIPRLHDLSCKYSQDVVLLLQKYHKHKEEQKVKGYHNAGYYQIIKGRNQYTKRREY